MDITLFIIQVDVDFLEQNKENRPVGRRAIYTTTLLYYERQSQIIPVAANSSLSNHSNDNVRSMVSLARSRFGVSDNRRLNYNHIPSSSIT